MDLKALLQLLRDHKTLQQLSLSTILSFISRASMLKHDIMQPQPLSVPTDMAPKCLPPSVSQFLGDSLMIRPDHVHECWAIFKDVIWDHPTADEARQVDKDAFKVHGNKYGLSEYLCNSLK
jgi:hypothetical protein